MKKVLVLIIGIMLAFPLVVNAAFSDLAENHWAASFITELSSKGVISGYPDGTFKPNGTLTKGEYLKLIVTASLPHLDYNIIRKDFTHWAAAYVKVAENYKVIEAGSINIDNINQPITRIEVIEILSQCDINMRKNEQLSTNELNFTDIDELSLKQNIMLSHAAESGIIGGYPDGTFKPNNNLTRAEVAKILSAYMNK